MIWSRVDEALTHNRISYLGLGLTSRQELTGANRPTRDIRRVTQRCIELKIGL